MSSPPGLAVLDAIHARRTVHAYVPEPVEDDVLRAILGAGHKAPCHKFTWPWRFVVVGPSTRAALVPVAVQLKAASKSLPVTDKLTEKVRAKLCNPGALIAVTLRRCDDAFRAREDYAAAACAIQNMMLAATAHCLGSKWGTGGITRAPETYAALGVDPDREEIIGFVSVGTAARVPTVERPPVADHVVRLP